MKQTMNNFDKLFYGICISAGVVFWFKAVSAFTAAAF